MQIKIPDQKLLAVLPALVGLSGEHAIQRQLTSMAESFLEFERKPLLNRAPLSLTSYELKGLRSAERVEEQLVTVNVVATDAKVLVAGVSWVVGVFSSPEDAKVHSAAITVKINELLQPAQICEIALSVDDWISGPGHLSEDLGYVLWDLTDSRKNIMLRFNVVKKENYWMFLATYGLMQLDHIAEAIPSPSSVQKFSNAT